MTLMWFCVSVVAIKLIVLSTYATQLWRRDPNPWELALIWLLPFYGALYVICLRAAVPAALAERPLSAH
jgi:hypothetical protein